MLNFLGMQKKSIKKFLPGIAWLFIVLVLTCLPGDDIPSAEWLDTIYFDKWVHVGMFGVLTVLFCWPFYRSGFSSKQRLDYFIRISLAASILGLAIEFIQRFYVPGRSYDLLDWAADSLGALIAFFFCKRIFLISPVKGQRWWKKKK